MRVVKTYYFEYLEPGEKKPRRSAFPMTIDEASRLFKGGVPIMATEKVTEILEAGDPDFAPSFGPSQHSRYMAAAQALKPGVGQTAAPDLPAGDETPPAPAL